MNDAVPPPSLDTPLEEFMFPARVWSLVARRGLVTLRDVVALAPTALLAERNVGRTSVADLRAVIESVTGMSWEEARVSLHASLPPSDAANEDAGAPTWVRIRNRLDPARRAVPLADLRALPTRMRSFAAARGIATVGALLDLSPESLRSVPNLGRKSIADTLEVLASLLATAPETVPPPPPAPTLDDYQDLEALWRALLGTLDRIDRIVIQHRSGLGTPASTLADIGEMLGVTRERIRQIESRAVRALGERRWWIEALRTRLDAQLTAGCVALETLSVRDPWLAPVATAPEVFAFIEDRYLEKRYAIVRIDGREYLARSSQESVDRAWSAIDEALVARSWPASRDEVASLVADLSAPLGQGVTNVLRDKAFARVIEDASAPDRLVGYGGTRHREILAWLRNEARPVTVAELLRRFGRGRWPEAIVFVERGKVTVPEYLQGFDALVPRVAERCAAHMRAHGPERQWSCAELAAVLADEPELPAWFGSWPLAGLLQRSDRVRYLGRGIVVLPEVEGERTHLRALLVEVLDAHGAPLPTEALRAKGEARRAVPSLSFDMLLQRAPFVEVAPDVIGLIPRDVPGGEAAVRRATDTLVALLDARGCGMSLVEALRRLRAGDAVFEAWSETLVRSVCGHDARLQTSASRAVGLAEWESLRMPTRREVIAAALADGGGRAAVEAVQARIEALYGERVSRNGLAWNAWHLDARLEGAFLVARDPEARASRPPTILAGVPEAAAARLEAILSEEFPRDDLGAAVKSHTRRFFMDAVTNEAIDLAQVIEAQRLCEVLLAVSGVDDALRRLAEAAVRYFVLSDDGAWDFTANGLDDDLAILRAVVARVEAATASRPLREDG